MIKDENNDKKLIEEYEKAKIIYIKLNANKSK
jgi:hypothetical protein